ncbi:MAG: hflC [Candidatus Paceibacter sp.]|jgi:regulator of protease activity HflC (stomatin/prohibitin superfamily)|nr:hflC [Candidatus Paceibacter sp.]
MFVADLATIVEMFTSKGGAAFLTLMTGTIVTFIKTFKFIQEGQRGVRLRFGKVIRKKDGSPKIYETGFMMMIPYIETLRRRHVRQQTFRLMNVRIILSDKLTFIFSAIVVFRVNDVYKALFDIENLDKSLPDFAMGVLRQVLTKRNLETLSDNDAITTELLEMVRAQGQQWGVEFSSFMLVDCAPTPETAQLVNVEIGSALKVKALQNAAKSLEVPVGRLNSTLGAVIAGIPLVTSIGASEQQQAQANSSVYNDNTETNHEGEGSPHDKATLADVLMGSVK